MSYRLMLCPYCGNSTALVRGSAIYPRIPELAAKWFYLCRPCDAYVGCHPGTTHPLGSLANAELRSARRRAHGAFDPIWHRGEMTRRDAYQWLATELNLSVCDCHIGMFDLETCVRVVELCRMVETGGRS